MTTPTTLIQYHAWAGKKVLERLMALDDASLTKDFGGSFPSIRLTTLHVLQADYRWLHRFKGKPIVEIPNGWNDANTRTMITTLLGIHQEMIQQVKSMTDINQLIRFTTAKGTTHEMPFDVLLTHVVNHGTYHRGQLVNMIRMAGAEAVGTDYFLYWLERNGG